jgi:hypothetical protein
MSEPVSSPALSNENAQARERPWVPILVTREGQYIIFKDKMTGVPGEKYFAPWIDPSDTRLFVRNGKLVRPYGIVTYAFDGIDSRPELDHDHARYHEVERSDFDPTGCVPIEHFDLEKYAKALNAPTANENAA